MWPAMHGAAVWVRLRERARDRLDGDELRRSSVAGPHVRRTSFRRRNNRGNRNGILLDDFFAWLLIGVERWLHPDGGHPRAREVGNVPAAVVYAAVDAALSPDFPLGMELEVFVRREDAERFIEEIRGDDPESQLSRGSRRASSTASAVATNGSC